MKLYRVNANLLCVGNITFACFSSTSKAVFYIKHNIIPLGFFHIFVFQSISLNKIYLSEYNLSTSQIDQVWRVMWSSGFHFCPLSSPVNDLPFPDTS